MAIMVVMVVLAMIANKKVTATGVANNAKTRVMATTRRLERFGCSLGTRFRRNPSHVFSCPSKRVN